jgi:hypothetical protein
MLEPFGEAAGMPEFEEPQGEPDGEPATCWDGSNVEVIEGGAISPAGPDATFSFEAQAGKARATTAISARRPAFLIVSSAMNGSFPIPDMLDPRRETNEVVCPLRMVSVAMIAGLERFILAIGRAWREPS